jgi:hypothetical protein
MPGILGALSPPARLRATRNDKGFRTADAKTAARIKDRRLVPELCQHRPEETEEQKQNLSGGDPDPHPGTEAGAGEIAL